MKSDKKIHCTIAPILLAGGVGVLPTDTLYGLVGSALKPEAVEKIYKLRKRQLKKPMIVLISSLDDLKLFGVSLTMSQQEILENIWPGKVSVVLPCEGKKFVHLNRGGKTVAFRLPSDKNLLRLLKEIGPLVAPSANLAGEKPASNYAEAKKYFNEKVDFYVDAGRLTAAPSTLIEINRKGEVIVLREGAVKFVL